MFLLRLGATGVDRIESAFLREPQKALRTRVPLRGGRDRHLTMTPSQERSSICAGARIRPRDGIEPTQSGLRRPETGTAHGFTTSNSSLIAVSQ